MKCIKCIKGECDESLIRIYFPIPLTRIPLIRCSNINNTQKLSIQMLLSIPALTYFNFLLPWYNRKEPFCMGDSFKKYKHLTLVASYNSVLVWKCVSGMYWFLTSGSDCIKDFREKCKVLSAIKWLDNFLAF